MPLDLSAEAESFFELVTEAEKLNSEIEDLEARAVGDQRPRETKKEFEKLFKKIVKVAAAHSLETKGRVEEHDVDSHEHKVWEHSLYKHIGFKDMSWTTEIKQLRRSTLEDGENHKKKWYMRVWLQVWVSGYCEPHARARVCESEACLHPPAHLYLLLPP